MTWSQAELEKLEPRRAMRLDRLLHGRADQLDRLFIEPETAARTPDEWQKDLLVQAVTRRRHLLLDCSSQVGKTEIVSLVAYLSACLGLYVVVGSPSDRQSVRFHRRLLGHHARLGIVGELESPSKHELWLVGGGRVEALPDSPDKIRGIDAVDLLIIDEASRARDELFGALVRTIVVSDGRIILLSTPNGRRGFFWDEWRGRGRTGWTRRRIDWRQCPRITPEHVAQERRRGGEWWVAQEYLDCSPGEEFVASERGYFDMDRFRLERRPDDEDLEW